MVGLPNWVGSVLEVGWLCTAKPNCHPSCLSENSSSFGYFLEPKKTSTMGDSGCGGMGATQLTHILSSLVMSSSRCSAPFPNLRKHLYGWCSQHLSGVPKCRKPSKPRPHITTLFCQFKISLECYKIEVFPQRSAKSTILGSWVAISINCHRFPSAKGPCVRRNELSLESPWDLPGSPPATKHQVLQLMGSLPQLETKHGISKSYLQK